MNDSGVCVRACVFVRACVRACVCVRVCVRLCMSRPPMQFLAVFWGLVHYSVFVSNGVGVPAIKGLSECAYPCVSVARGGMFVRRRCGAFCFVCVGWDVRLRRVRACGVDVMRGRWWCQCVGT